MKKYTKYAALGLSALMLFGLVGCQKQEEPAPVEESTEEVTVESTETEEVEAVTPYTLFDTLAEASEAMGFEIPAPEAFGDYTLASVAVYDDFADLYFLKNQDEDVEGLASEVAEQVEEAVDGLATEVVEDAEAPEAEVGAPAEEATEEASEEAADETATTEVEALESEEATEEEAVAEMPAEIVIRITKSTEDVFGDYAEYTEDVDVDGVTLRMAGDAIGAAKWVDGEFTYYMYLTDANLKDADVMNLIGAFTEAMLPEEMPVPEMPALPGEEATEEATEEAPVEDAATEEAPAEETTDAN